MNVNPALGGVKDGASIPGVQPTPQQNQSSVDLVSTCQRIVSRGTEKNTHTSDNETSWVQLESVQIISDLSAEPAQSPKA